LLELPVLVWGKLLA